MMLTIRHLSFVLVAMLSSQSVAATESIDQIISTWNRHFGIATRNGHYHYKCQLVQRPAVGVSHVQGFKPEFLEYELEVFRLGDATRFEIQRDDISEQWIEIYDGESKFNSSSDRSHWQINAGRALKTKGIDDPMSIPDPLSDVLGLSLPTWPPFWQRDLDWTHAHFSPWDSLASQDLHIVSANSQVVELTNSQGDQLVLSVPHHYGISARTWKVQAQELLVYSLQNDDWQMLENGMPYPAVSTVTCKREVQNELLFTIDFKFMAMRKAMSSDFKVVVDTPGTDITYFGGAFDGGGHDMRSRRVIKGEKIDLNAVASGSTSIRWDAREWPPFTFWEPLNVVPLVFAMASLWTSFRYTRFLSSNTARRVLLQTVMLLTASCFVTIHTAMLLYKGGTIESRKLEGYSWTSNFLSDLGRDCTCYAYRENTPSNYLFLFGMSLAGVSIGLYMWILPSLFTTRIARCFAFIASVCGIIAAWCFIRVGLEPIDRDFHAHQWYATAAFLSLACTAAACAGATFSESSARGHDGLRLLILASLIVSYLVIRHFDDGRVLLGTGWLWRQAVAQKLVFYAIGLTMMLQVRETLTRRHAAEVGIA